MLESCDNRARGEKRNGAMFRRHAERSKMADSVIDAGQQVSPLGRCAAPRLVCFAREVCHFAMKGLPLGLQETISGFSERSTGGDERATSYHAYATIRPVISQKRAIDPKVCRIARKVCREKSVWQPKIKKCLEISRHFSRQRYASNLRSRQRFLTTSVQLVGDRQYP
jgi:hypothetical protein